DREHDQPCLVTDLALEPDGAHARVVHGVDGQAGDEAAGEQAGGDHGLADDVQPDVDGDDGEDRRAGGPGHVVAQRDAGDGEAEHGDEVHQPDADSADGDGRHDQPALPLAFGAGADRAAGGGQADEGADDRHDVGEPHQPSAHFEVVDVVDVLVHRMDLLGFEVCWKGQRARSPARVRSSRLLHWSRSASIEMVWCLRTTPSRMRSPISTRATPRATPRAEAISATESGMWQRSAMRAWDCWKASKCTSAIVSISASTGRSTDASVRPPVMA